MYNKSRLLLLTVALLTLVARMSFPVMAQNPTGSIRGVVKDQRGAVITNASVTVTIRRRALQERQNPAAMVSTRSRTPGR